MSIHVDASFNATNDISYEALGLKGNAAGNDGGPEVKTITVDGNAYKVTLADDGKVSVSFATTSFFHLFMGSAKAAVRDKIQELVDLNSYVKDVSGIVARTSQNDNVIRTISQESQTIIDASGGKFAHYGFSGVRENAQKGIWHVSTRIDAGRNAPAENQGAGDPGREHAALESQLINEYNKSISLAESNISAARTIMFVRDNNQGTWNKTGGGAGISPEERLAWRDYLKDKDVDLFSKIRKAKVEAEGGKTTGWAGEIQRQGLEGAVRDMVRKNIDPRMQSNVPNTQFVISSVAKAIIEVSEMDLSGLGEAEIDKKIDECVARHAPCGMKDAARMILDNAATGAFWRQTSKLGLDFFKERGIPIVFEWTKYNGEATDGTEIQDKWWKDANADIGDHHGAAITNSEMRHILKQEKAGQIKDGVQVIKVGGGQTSDAVEALIRRKVEGLRNLPADEIKMLLGDLSANFDSLKASDFHDVAQHALMNLPNGWLVVGSAALTDRPEDKANWVRAVDEAFDRVKARISAVKSPVVKAAMLMNVAELFEAELSRDRSILEMEPDSPNPSNEDPNVVCTHRLAGLDRGRGMDVFFAPDTGLPNALGQLVLDTADGDVARMTGVVTQLRTAFADKLGCQPEKAFEHPAFRSFLVRAASRANSVDGLIGMLDIVKDAHEAKTEVKRHLAQLDELPPEVQRLYDRRGNWDVDRLVFNEALNANRSKEPVDVEKLKHNAEVIRNICTTTVAFVDEVAREIGPGAELNEAERRRLADSYLDRENSAVNSYRLQGSEEKEALLATEHQDILDRTKAQIRTILSMSKGGLPPEALKSLVIDGVATKAKNKHLQVVIASLDAAMKGGRLSVSGRSIAERMQSAISALAERVRTAFAEARVKFHGTEDEFGYDDDNTATRLYFNAYLNANPNIKSFFDDAAADPKSRDWLQQHLREYENDVVMKHLFDNVIQYGVL